MQATLSPRNQSMRRISNTDLAHQAQGGKAVSNGNIEQSGHEIFDAECLRLINEYFYGVRIFPGQDPTHVYVGWVTTQYHFHGLEFNLEKVRRSSVAVAGDYDGQILQQ